MELLLLGSTRMFSKCQWVILNHDSTVVLWNNDTVSHYYDSPDVDSKLRLSQHRSRISRESWLISQQYSPGTRFIQSGLFHLLSGRYSPWQHKKIMCPAPRPCDCYSRRDCQIVSVVTMTKAVTSQLHQGQCKRSDQLSRLRHLTRSRRPSQVSGQWLVITWSVSGDLWRQPRPGIRDDQWSVRWSRIKCANNTPSTKLLKINLRYSTADLITIENDCWKVYWKVWSIE